MGGGVETDDVAGRMSDEQGLWKARKGERVDVGMYTKLLDR